MKKLIIHIYGDENNFLDSLKEVYRELRENKELKSVRWETDNTEIDINILDYNKYYIQTNKVVETENYKKLPHKKSIPKK